MGNLKRLDDILVELGMTKASYFQLPTRGIKTPAFREKRPNTRGRGTEYLYDEDEVKAAVEALKSRKAKVVKHDEEDVIERIKSLLLVGPITKAEVRKKFGLKVGTSVENHFSETLEELVRQGLVEKLDRSGIGAPTLYTLK